MTAQAMSPMILDAIHLAIAFLLCYVLFRILVAYGDWKTRRDYERAERSEKINRRVRAYYREQEARSRGQTAWW